MRTSEPFWTETFGGNLCVLAGTIGMPAEDTALITSSLLGNLAGPVAGIEDISGRRIQPGCNLLYSGEDHFRYRSTMKHLLEPVQSLQRYLRDTATRTPRPLADMNVFGSPRINPVPADLARTEPLYDRCLRLRAAVSEDLTSGDGLPPRWDEPYDAELYRGSQSEAELFLKRLPGIRHRPSLLFLTNDVESIDGMLGEAHDETAFLVDNTGGFFEGSHLHSAAKGNKSIHRLTQYMAGSDAAFVPLPQQGYGVYREVRVRVMASLTLARVGEIIASEEPIGMSMLKNSILWHPGWTHQVSNPEGRCRAAWQSYRNAVARVANERIHRSGPIVRLQPDSLARLQRAEVEFDKLLFKQPAHLNRFLSPFASLISRLWWVFTVLNGCKEPDWCHRAAIAAANHALTGHLKVIEDAVTAGRQATLERQSGRVLEVLRQKGASSVRDIQRSLFGMKRSDIQPALDLLQTREAVRYLGDRREYELLQTSQRGGRASTRNQEDTRCSEN